MPKRVTLQDIADAAELSKMTVSLALRNSPKIKRSTAEYVRNLAKEMNYMPNPLMSAHMTELRLMGKTKSSTRIAYISPMGPNDSKTVEYFRGAEKRALETGYQFDFFQMNKGLSSRRASDILFHRNVAGVIIGNHEKPTWDFEMDWQYFAIAMLGYSVKDLPAHRVCSNQFQGSRMACEKLSELGYKRIALFLDEDSDLRTDCNWTGGYFAFAAHSSSASGQMYCNVDTFSPEPFMKWFKKCKPDAIVTSSKLISKVHSTLLRNGVGVPEAVGLVNLHYSRDKKNYTSVDQHSEVTGECAVNLIVEQLLTNEYGLPEFPRVVMNNNTWWEGDTTRSMH